MVGTAAQDLEPAIDLFEREQTDEPVRNREPAERDQPARARADLVAVSIGAADREHHGRAAAVLRFGAEDRFGELDAGDRRSALVERVEVGVRGKRGEQRSLVLGLVYGERTERAQALAVLVLGLEEIRLLESTDDRERDLQRAASPNAPS